MNIHFPQSDLARAEAYTIALGDEQYIVPTDGSPLRGLIQDHVVMGSLLTNKDTMLTREEFQQLLYAAISTLPPTRGSAHLRYQTPIITIPPCIVKPVPLWSGKQVVRDPTLCGEFAVTAGTHMCGSLIVSGVCRTIADQQSADGAAQGLPAAQPGQQLEDPGSQLEGSLGGGQRHRAR